ncbi:alpha/beta hydrolase [Rhodococcus sp. G-MC3]|uniref:alpha/beta hydrolase family protein n=1 Tax=Rhodococcus sp. G-MC3 TaxID=3046209 RepID=UPI0024BB794A|nr:alpha/beta hydrolase [Rhodococcus sp. G-MC3]MDJ0394562.1 alpha/beta hydrolase [Rhodococcus sp. G-MC3]
MNRIKIDYGEHPEQYGHLYLPESPVREPLPVVMVVHGGSWSGRYALTLGTQYAVEFARAGLAAWNIEYRRVGKGGVWPEVGSDVSAALQAVGSLVQQHSPIPFDTNDIRVIGHSAGGHLAVWMTGERQLPIRPSLVVSQAGVLDLAAGPASGHANPAVESLLDARYEDAPELYRAASPLHRLPTGVPVRCIHGAADVQVPVTHSERYVAAATAAGDVAGLSVIDGEDHFAFLAPGTECWKQSMAAVLNHRPIEPPAD